MSDTAGVLVLVGRMVFSMFFLAAAMMHFTKPEQMIGYARAMRFPIPVLAGYPAGLWLAAGGASVAAGIWPDIGALMLGLFVVATPKWFHRFWALQGDEQQMQMQLFFRNVITLGAVLVFFAVFAWLGEGLRYTITEPLISIR